MVPNAKAPEEDEADVVGRAASLRGMNEYLTNHVPGWIADVRSATLVKVVWCSVLLCMCVLLQHRVHVTSTRVHKTQTLHRCSLPYLV